MGRKNLRLIVLFLLLRLWNHSFWKKRTSNVKFMPELHLLRFRVLKLLIFPTHSNIATFILDIQTTLWFYDNLALRVPILFSVESIHSLLLSTRYYLPSMQTSCNYHVHFLIKWNHCLIQENHGSLSALPAPVSFVPLNLIVIHEKIYPLFINLHSWFGGKL